ncbi:MAG: TIGR00730 family Rossman fold protein [Kutzneria sp.]|nr:TIGR00730 family Rossman fold protein [Kutzneria sp.]
MGSLQHVAVFTGSSVGHAPAYGDAAESFGRDLAEAGVGIVFGGGRVGLMGRLADGALAGGGQVHGVMPRSLVDREIAHKGLTKLQIVGTMHERKAAMAAAADAFVALPGGAGTLEELFEAWTWQQLGLHDKPVALLDVDGFWKPLVRMVDHMVSTGFLAGSFRDALLVVPDAAALLAAVGAWQPPRHKWSRPEAGRLGPAPPADGWPRR